MLGDEACRDRYHRELKQATLTHIRLQKRDDETVVENISRTAWELCANDGMAGEAVILIDEAIRLYSDCPAEAYNRKAMILKHAFRYEEALECFDRALSMDRSNETIIKNRAECEAVCIKSKLEIEVIVKRVQPHHLDLINSALKILPNDCDNRPYLNVKADILGQLGDPVKAGVCRALAVKDYDKVDEVERQLKKLKNGETYITIAGIHYYKGFEPFREGIILDIIREPNNPYDGDAIRVAVGGETVGYIANNKYTLIREVRSATDIKDVKSARAQVQFILFGQWVIAKIEKLKEHL